MISFPREMIATYLKRRGDDIVILKKSLEDNSTTEFHRVGHQLKGNARSFGYPDLEPIAIRMESLPDAELQNVGALLIDEFSSWLQISLKEFQSHDS